MSSNPLPKLEIRLLGAPQISANGAGGAERPSTKAQALLYYLAMTGRPHTRIALAALLWGEHGEGEARRNLRKVIQQLREHFDPYLAIDHHTVGFHSAQCYWVDAVEFTAQMADTRTANPERLQAALALYQGDFLEGFYVRDAPDFEAWMLSERARLREFMLDGLTTLATGYANQGDLPQAIAALRRLLELEPWREEAHRQLMLWLVQNGQRNAALLQYELCCRALAEELAVEPEQTTRELYTQILQQEPAAPTRQAPLAVVDYTLVGRQTAWQTLRSAWTKAMQSGMQMVCISGEAGIGKTRLAEELLLHIQRQGHATARTRAYALEGRLAYAPLADWLRSPPLQGKVAKLNQLWRSEVARLLPELLIQQPTLAAPQPLAERWQQKQFFEALRHAFTADPRPLLLLLDDLQWCDPDTLAWLQYLFDTAPQTPLLVVGTVRSDEVADDHPFHKLRRILLHAGKLTTIDLTPLSAEETAALGAQVAKHALDNRAVTQLYQATAGNPLFVIESVRIGDKANTGSADAAGERPQMMLPPKVYAVIEARLAQLSPVAQTLAQIAATIGRTFTVSLLVAASHQDEEQVVQGLDELWQRRLVREQGNARYDFSHDRIRDVAYAESSPVKRALFHQRVALALEKLYADNLDAVAGELAGHYQGAGSLAQAFAYFQQAAKMAKQLYAHSEEADYLQKALAIVQLLPPNAVSPASQSDLWSELGSAQVLIHDWRHELVATAWQKADEWAVQAGNPVQRCETLGSLCVVARNQGEWRKAYDLCELALSLAKASGEPSLIDGVSSGFAATLTYIGELPRALEHYQVDSLLVQPTANGPSLGTVINMAQCLWLLGFPDQALARVRQVFAIKEENLPFVNRFTRPCFAGVLYAFLHDAPMVQRLGQELIDVSIQCDFPLFESAGQILVGWAIAQQGEIHAGLALLRAGLAGKGRDSRMLEPFWRTLLVETLALAGERETAFDEATAILAYTEECGNRFCNAHLLKLKGDLLLACAAPADEVEPWYQQAIATARQQGAKSLELRATVSLCRLWQGVGQQAAARSLLAEIYGWFTEGFDTVDLQEAKALLEEL